MSVGSGRQGEGRASWAEPHGLGVQDGALSLQKASAEFSQHARPGAQGSR